MSSDSRADSQIGRPLRRVEDPRLVRGLGRYAADLKPEQLAHMAIVRSPLPHARISAIDVAGAKSLPGVLAVWTAQDLPAAARRIEDLLPRGVVGGPRPVLAETAVHHVGEAVAVVVAEDAYLAQDAALAVAVDYEPLPGVAGAAAASSPGAPRVHDDLPSNVTGERVFEYGDIEAAFARDSVVTSARFRLARICGAAMEPRALMAEPTAEGGIVVWDSTQAVFHIRDLVAQALGLDKNLVAVVAEDVGGGFGPKGQTYPEEVLVPLLARHLGRPVRWTAGRSEDTVTTMHGHGSVIDLEIAAGPDGRLRGLRGRLLHDTGAYPAAGSAQPNLIVPHMMSCYRLPALRVESAVVLTNTTPTGFVRGGGRPVGNYCIERMMDRLARTLAMDPAELRRRNLIQPDEMPYDTGFPVGRSTVVYDGGDYPRLLQIALDKIGYEQFRSQPRDGRLRGVGLACCVESSGFGRGEPARVRLEKDGLARLFIGSTPQGQGHRTMAAQVLADRLGWPLERIEVVAGDSRVVEWAELTAGSRTAVQVGNATSLAGRAARRLLLESAAEVLEADAADLVLEHGMIMVRGVPGRSLPVADAIPDEGLEVTEIFDPPRPLAYSSGCHAALVEVDPETGSVVVLRYVIVHDTGRAINEMIVRGQMQGGFVHGIGYALFEEAVYQEDGGFLSASFLDYTIPGLPEADEALISSIVAPTDANPEGFKGAGESGTVPVPAAIANAVEDALGALDPAIVVADLPITPNRVLELMRRSRS